ncbi:kinetochore-associated Ndc80 complex subunit spc25 [Coemansia sp. RSA 2052]|nr:kinetochore-associated Ndc80 complex subunit spc25 [Coemansia sp. RSA 2052]
MVTELKRLVREQRVEHERQMGEAQEREVRMARDMDGLETEHQGVLAALKDELSAEDELSSELGRLQVRQRMGVEAVRMLVARRDRAQTAVNERLAVVEEKRAVLGVQRAVNELELKFFEEKMGLAVSGGGNPDLLTFVFTQISVSDPHRAYTVTVDLSQREYQATDCKPPLPGLQGHVEWLNTSRDFYGFLKRVRREFISL